MCTNKHVCVGATVLNSVQIKSEHTKGSIVNGQAEDAHVVRVKYAVAPANCLPTRDEVCCAKTHLGKVVGQGVRQG